MQYYILAFQKYAQFSGRSNRTEYWMFFLFNFLISCFLNVISLVLVFLNTSQASDNNLLTLGTTNAVQIISLLGLVYSLVTIIPSIALNARRLHDIGKSGWLQLINFIPVIGWIFFLIWVCTPGDQGENDYGKRPTVAITEQEDL